MTKILTLVFAVLLFANIISGIAFAQSMFSAKTDFSTGTNPNSVAIGDFNGDGKPDLAVVNNNSTSFSVFLNTTTTGAVTPTYSAKTDYTTGASPNCVAIGDFNGDGKPDIAVTNNSPNSVSVFLNTTVTGSATPTFSAKTDFTATAGPVYVSICDFNGDGKPDMVVVNYAAAFVSVFFNTTATGAATPTFSAKTDFATVGNFTRSVTTGDLNGDGKPDMAIANNASVSVYFNTTATGAATPTFSARTDFANVVNVYQVSISDLNGDGKPDLISANNGSVSVLLNTTTTGAATPTFSANTNFASNAGASSVSISDLNDDGKPDMAVVGGAVNQVSVFLNTTTPGAATPTFSTRVNFTSGTTPYFVSTGDLNGDGKLDLVTTNYNDNSVSVFLNTMILGVTPASFSAKTDFTVGSNPTWVSVGDINGDGKPDLAVANLIANSVSVFLNTTTTGAAAPTFSAKTDFTTGSNPEWVSFGDFNGDGKPDMATTNVTSNTVSVFLNTTTPGATTPTFSAKTDFSTGVPSNPYSVAIGDLNGDGKPDMAVSNSNAVTNTISVFLNTTTPGAAAPTFTVKTDFTTGTAPYQVSIGDFNGDGKPDLVVVNRNATSASVFLNTTTPGASTPTFTAKTDFTTGAGTVPTSVSIGDFNGDGKPDFATANSTNVSVYLNTSTPGALTPTFSARTDFTSGNSPASIIISDFNGDGKPDMATANVIGTASVLLNTTTPGASTPTFSANTDFTTGAGAQSVSFGDFNGDGLKDLVTANKNVNNISVLLSTVVLPLPVELASFTSSVNSNNVTLNWSTVQEQNNKGFEIERNSFGSGWKKIGYTDGHGTTNSTQNYLFKDNSLKTGTYSYRLKQIDYNGNFEYFGLSNEVVIGVPSKYSLAQNYPNPFNPETKINYSLPTSGNVSIKIFDIAGKEIRQLVNQKQEAGYYTVRFNASNISSGTYFYKLSINDFSEVKKMMVVK